MSSERYPSNRLSDPLPMTRQARPAVSSVRLVSNRPKSLPMFVPTAPQTRSKSGVRVPSGHEEGSDGPTKGKAYIGR